MYTRPLATLRQSTAVWRRTKSTATTPSSGGTSTSATTTSTSGTHANNSVPIGKTALAALCAISFVSASAAVVETTSAASAPTYHPQAQRFDQTSFVGRFSKMLLACDPRLLFYTEAQVKRSQEMIQNYKDFQGTVHNRALWEARRIVDAALHPDTGEFIPRPFRMSGYVPYNGPICVSMVASTSTPALLFWSWANQSQNALVNYYNRNASSDMTNETLAISYAAAVGSALLVAFGLATTIQKRFEPARAKAMLRWVAFPSAVIASSLNCYIVRSPEIESGIPLLDADGNDILPGATSSIAAAQGVYATTLSRAILQAPVYFVPPLLLTAVPPIRRYLQRNPRMTVPITTGLVLTSFGLGLPLTVAIFPQMATLDAQDVESQFQHLRDPLTARPYEQFFYNKGL
jgi:tricarboxylate carrier